MHPIIVAVAPVQHAIHVPTATSSQSRVDVVNPTAVRTVSSITPVAVSTPVAVATPHVTQVAVSSPGVAVSTHGLGIK